MEAVGTSSLTASVSSSFDCEFIDQEIKMGKGKGELDDKEKMWKNSLRPLDPGILSDQIKKKKER